MAKSAVLHIAICFVLLVISPKVRSNPNTKEITLFGTVINQGPHANTVLVAGNPNNTIIPGKFGTVSVFDSAQREAISTDFPIVARSQGLNVISSINGTQAYLSFAIHFITGEYKDSTLQLQGTVELAGLASKGELALSSGTEYFRHVRGFALTKTVSQNPTTSFIIQKLQIYIKFDH